MICCMKSASRTDAQRAEHLLRSKRPRRHGEIQCKVCGADSTPNDTVSFGVRCRSCYNKWQKANSRKNKSTQRAQLAAHLHFHYGMTLDHWDKLMGEQDGKCAICSRKPTGDARKRDKRLQVDHCHKTGQIRGLVCLKCNLHIGHAERAHDYPDAMRYIQKHGISDPS